MKYKVHEGIVYTTVCNVPLLIATRPVWDDFPGVKRLSPIQGYFFSSIISGLEENSIVDIINLPIKKESLEKQYKAFLQDMIHKRYLVEVDSSDQ